VKEENRDPQGKGHGYDGGPTRVKGNLPGDGFSDGRADLKRDSCPEGQPAHLLGVRGREGGEGDLSGNPAGGWKGLLHLKRDSRIERENQLTATEGAWLF